MITGSNDVYTPVDAYGVTTFTDGIISGGNTGNESISGSTRFLWVYDPNSPCNTPSGFTSQGWFSGVSDTPIEYYLRTSGKKLENLMDEFNLETNPRTNLNDVFELWQKYVIENSSSNFPGKFVEAIGTSNCYLIGF